MGGQRSHLNEVTNLGIKHGLFLVLVTTSVLGSGHAAPTLPVARQLSPTGLFLIRTPIIRFKVTPKSRVI